MYKPSPKQSGEPPTAPGAKAKDLVCKMDVHTDGALTNTYQGRTFYFCSEECRDRFKEDPAKYVK